ncbi:MAG TPA: SufE family protein [Herpetosiphonaceae bacterium]
MSETQIPPRLEEIIEDFKLAEGAEKLELLLEYARNMPPLPAWLHGQRDAMEQVHECMTPVFVYAENQNNHLKFHFDVPEESPTVRGYAALLSEGVEGATPEEVLRIPGDFYQEMGLQDVLSPRRLQGVHTILAYIKRLATKELASEAGQR